METYTDCGRLPYSAKFLVGKNFDEFGKLNVIRQYFTHIH